MSLLCTKCVARVLTYATVSLKDAPRHRFRAWEVETYLRWGREYREVWMDETPPGGYVCNTCGVPVESEPCPEHAPTTEPLVGAESK